MKHKIFARHNGVIKDDRLPIALIKRCVCFVLDFEGVDLPCEVSVLITDDNTIRAINNEFRGIDKATDVLSFPMIGFSPPGWVEPVSGEIDPESGLIPLGEIVLSAQRVRGQAVEYNQSTNRETAYLVVHSVLHLLGYDHVDEGEGKRRMRAREKKIMSDLALSNTPELNADI